MKRMSKKISIWLALVLVAMIVLSNAGVLTAKAANTDNESSDFLKEPDYIMLNDVNTLGATVSVKSMYLKVKKDDAAQSPKPTKVTVNGKTLKLNRDYTLAYQKYSYNYVTEYEQWNNVNSMAGTGTYRMCIIGKGDYSGVCVKRIYVYDPAKKVPMSSVKVAVNKVPYTGKPITEGVIKSIKYKNIDLMETGYGRTYLQNTNSGTGIVRIEGTGKFVGEKEVKFQITGGTKMNKAKITGIAAKTYDCGNELTQDMSKVKVVIAGKELTYGTDYDISYTNNKKAGTAKISFTGKGAYYGTVTKSFKVGKVKLNEDMLGKVSKSIMVKYTKKAVKPDVTLYDAHGERLVKGVDYMLAYKNNVKMSDKAVITVKGKGSYTGSFKVNFTITDKDIVEQPDKDEKPSEGSGEGEKPSEGSDEGKTDEGEKPFEGSNEGEKPSEGDGEDKPAGGNGEDGSGESKPNDNGTGDGGDEPEATKPGSRICWCGYTVNISDFNHINSSELWAWKAHVYDVHMRKGESTNYTDKYSDGTEIEGVCILDAGNVSGSETAKPGTRVCQCGFTLDIGDFASMTIDEAQIWNGHAQSHNDPDNVRYTNKYSDGTETLGSGLSHPHQVEGWDPISMRFCQCGYVMVCYYRADDDEHSDEADFEWEFWGDHMDQHTYKGEPSNYTSTTWEKYLKLKRLGKLPADLELVDPWNP